MAKFAVNVEGAKYEVEAPDENTAWQWAYTTHMQGQRPASKPAAPKIPERTFGEAFTDIGAAGLGGIGSLVQLPGQLYGLATGDFSKTGALGAGQELEEYAKSLKSQSLLAREKARSEKVAQAEKEGQLAAFKAAFGETVSDPALLTSFLAEQLPQIIPAAITGGGTAALTSGSVLAKELAKGTAKEAAEAAAKKAAIKSGTTAAVQTGAVQQGADIGAGSYDEIYAELSKRMPAEQAAAETINLARAAGVTGYGLSVLANRFLPGGSALERVLAGEKTGKGIIRGGVAGALKELPSENVEEVGGRLAQNIAARTAGLDRDLTSGLGETAAMASIGAAGMGGVTGIVGGRQSDQQIRDEVLRQEALKQREEEQQKQEAETAITEEVKTEPEKKGKPSIVGTEFEEVAPGTVIETPPVDIAEVQRDPKIMAMQAEYDKRDAEIKELESRGMSLTKGEQNKLTNKRNSNAKLKVSIDDALSTISPKGAEDATGTLGETAGASTALSTQPAVIVPPTAGAGEAQRNGVVSTGADVTGTAEGKGTKPAPIATEAQVRALTDKDLNDKLTDQMMFGGDDVEYKLLKDEQLRRKTTQSAGAPLGTQTPQAQQTEAQGQKPPAAPTVKTAIQEDEDLINKLFGDDGLPSAGSARRTKAQIEKDKQDAAQLAELGQRYGLTQRDGELQQDFGQRIRKAYAFEKERQGKPLSAMGEQDIAGQELKEEQGYFPSQEERDLYEETRQDYNSKLEKGEEPLPAYKELGNDERLVYFRDNIKRNDQTEHDRAVKDLADYRESQKSEVETYQVRDKKTNEPLFNEDGTPLMVKAPFVGETKARRSYNQQRSAFSQKTGLSYEFPIWGDLSTEARKAYAAFNKKDSPLELDMAFRAVKKQIQKDLSEQTSREGLQAAESRATQEMLAAGERARKSQPAGKGQVLPLDILKKLARGDIKSVLEYLSTQGHGLKLKRGYDLVPFTGVNGKTVLRRGVVNIRDSVAMGVFRTLAGTLSNIADLKVNVVFDKNMIHEQIAKYDANTNTLYVGPYGLDEATILHELTHAATVKIIHQFFTDKTKLDPRVAASVERLIDIASAAKAKLGSKYPNAFDNLYEFIAYAMTDMEFQNELAGIQIPRLAYATAKTQEQSEELQLERETGVREGSYDSMFDNLWDYFTGTLAFMYKLFRPEQTRQKILMPTEKTGTPQKATKEKTIAPREQKEKRELDLAEKEALAPESLFDSPEEADVAEIPPLKGELVNERGVTNLRREILRSPGYKGNLLLEAAAAFQNILAAPEGGIERLAGKETIGEAAELSAKAKEAAGTTQKPTTQKAPAKVDVTTEEAIKRNELPETSGINALRKLFTTRQGGMNLVTKFQNARYAIKSWEDGLTRAGKIIYSGSKLNNIYTQIALAASRAKDLYLTRVNTPASDMQSAIGAYAEASGLTSKEATERLHVYLMGLHEGERRDVKYMLNVPLSNDKILKIGNEILSPAEFRERIMDEVLSGTLNKTQIETARTALDNVVAKYKDPTGSSPNGYKSVDRNNEEYNVIGGYTPKSIQNFRDSYENDPNKKEVDKVIAAMRKLQDATRELNKEANYWSAPVQSIVDFYGWKNYVPFAGKEKYTNDADAALDFNSKRNGRELQEGQNSFEGRETDSDNSIVQSLTDATRAAMRAGRRDVTLAIKNAVAKDKDGNQLLKGRIFKTIPFADRYKDLNIGEEKKENVIFHYNKDGSIDVIEIFDKAQRNAIRRTYEQSQPIIDMLNHITSGVGQMHTRYNIAFAPVNFFRDALTNAYSIGVEMGPKASAQYLGAIATNVASGGLFRAAKVAALYEAGKFDQIRAMAKKNDYVRDMLEFIEQGGKVSYLAGLSSKGQFKELQKSLDRTGILKTKDQIDKFVDIYTDMFELASRTAAYRVAKSQALAENLSPADAQVKAAGYAKGLANFEQVGEWGRAAGAAFMFFRPAATGAVRAIETLGPMLRDPQEALKELPEYIQKDKVASAEFLKKYNEQKKAATAMTLGLLGMGSAIYLMSMALSDDDDLGRNRSAIDDPNRWSRYARFHIPGMDTPIQIPWGFGLGAFASAGAQVTALATGNSSVKNALSNIVVTGLDSFLPLPVSRISPIDNFPAWAMDSATPSVARPFLEWVMNVDGLGREIYNNRQSRYGDAYTGGDNIPELYKSAARTLAEITDGKVDWSPNTMYFFANNYGDGLMRLAQTGYNYGLLAAGEKAFNPKTDTVLFDSFFGAPSNYDARQFSEVEKQILSKQQKLNMFKDSNPEAYARYVEKNPMDEYIVEHYNKVINQDLKKLREEANIYRRMPGLTPKERTEAVKNVVKFQNLVKRGIIEDFEMMGVEP